MELVVVAGDVDVRVTFSSISYVRRENLWLTVQKGVHTEKRVSSEYLVIYALYFFRFEI